MIRKICLSILLLGVISSGAIAEDQLTIPPESTSNTITLKDLNFKTVMMAFYQKQIKHIVIPELEKDKTKYVGFSEGNHSQTSVLIYSPSVAYRNPQNQQRFLLTVSKVPIDVESREINYCFACSSFNDIYIFKKNSDQNYELVSKAVGEDAWVGLGADDDTYDPNRILLGLVNVGPHIKGVVRENETSHQGYTIKTLNIAPMNELLKFKMIEIDTIHTDNELTGDDVLWGYDAQYQFLDSVQDGLYDLKIQYNGTDRKFTSKGILIVLKNETHIYKYNEQQQKYLRAQ